MAYVEGELSPHRQQEIMLAILTLLFQCDHDWTDWQWHQPRDADVSQWAKQCTNCKIWYFDIETNVVQW